MPNPILELLSNQNGTKQQAPVSNPIELLLRQNPNYQNVMNYIQKNGGNAKTAFYNLCQQKGIDPNQILGMFQKNKT